MINLNHFNKTCKLVNLIGLARSHEIKSKRKQHTYYLSNIEIGITGSVNHFYNTSYFSLHCVYHALFFVICFSRFTFYLSLMRYHVFLQIFLRIKTLETWNVDPMFTSLKVDFDPILPLFVSFLIFFDIKGHSFFTEFWFELLLQ